MLIPTVEGRLDSLHQRDLSYHQALSNQRRRPSHSDAGNAPSFHKTHLDGLMLEWQVENELTETEITDAYFKQIQKVMIESGIVGRLHPDRTVSDC